MTKIENKLRVLLIRHGESENNILMEISRDHYRENRVADPSLTELGHAQALATANYLKTVNEDNSLLHEFHEVYVSPCLRTIQTASPIISAIDIKSINGKAKIWTDIFEVGGVHEKGKGQTGLTRDEMFRLCQDSFDIPESVTDRGWYTHNDYECHETAQNRIYHVASVLKGWARNCGKENRDKTIILIVHGDFINYLLQALLGTNECKSSVFHAYNTSLHLLDIFHDEKVSLLFHNNVDHLNSGALCKTNILGRL